VVLGDGTDCDVIALAEDQLEAAVQISSKRRPGPGAARLGWTRSRTSPRGADRAVPRLCAWRRPGRGPGRAAAQEARPARRVTARRPRPVRLPRRPDRERPGRAQEILVPAAPPTRSGGDLASLGRGGPVRSGRCAATRRRCWTRWPERRRVAGPAQDPPGQRPHHPQPALQEIQDALGLTPPCCGSSATTCPTCRARSALMVVFEDGLA
jgi:hypothetical protein